MVKPVFFNRMAVLSCITGLCLTSCQKESLLTPTNDATSFVAGRNENLQMSTVPLSTTTTLEVGINGHPLGTLPYTTTPASRQIQLLKDMNMKWYRIDVQSTSTGNITVPYLWEPLQEAAAAGGVKILPMLYTRTLSFSVSESESYQRGKTLGSNFAAKYGRYFTYYNLGNEMEMDCLLPGTSGQSQEHYNKAKYRIIRNYLKGMDEGIKSKDPDAKTMIDASWLHYAFLRMLDWDGVKFDVVAYHWYSEMEGAAAGSMYKIPDITRKLSSLFPTKPIWFTEVNNRYKTGSTTYERDQNTFITKFIEKCKSNPQVKVVMIYELFNEPQKLNVLEANYGILKWTVPYTSWARKIIANTLYLK